MMLIYPMKFTANFKTISSYTHCDVQYAGENITPLNLRMSIHRRGKSGCEISVDHYKNVCKNATFSIHIIEKLPENGYENWVKNYCMKTLHIVYLCGLNERIKFMNKDSAKLFPPLPRYDEHFIDTKTRSKITTHDLSFDIEIFVNILKQFLFKYRSNESQKLLKSFKKRKLNLFGSQAQKLQYKNFQKDGLSHNRYHFSKSI